MEPSKELPEFIVLAKQLNGDMEQKYKETAARKKRKYQKDNKDKEEDLVFKWKNKFDETTMKSTNSSEKEVEFFFFFSYLFTCIVYCHSHLHHKLKNCLVLLLRLAHLFTFISL